MSWHELAIGDLVIVEWEDTTNVAAWQDPEELKAWAADGGWHCRNVGWLVYADGTCLVVAARRSDSDHSGLSERIPRCAVKSIQTLRSAGTDSPTFP